MKPCCGVEMRSAAPLPFGQPVEAVKALAAEPDKEGFSKLLPLIV
jgi:hypothetical protein